MIVAPTRLEVHGLFLRDGHVGKLAPALTVAVGPVDVHAVDAADFLAAADTPQRRAFLPVERRRDLGVVIDRRVRASDAEPAAVFVRPLESCTRVKASACNRYCDSSTTIGVLRVSPNFFVKSALWPPASPSTSM